MLNVALAGNPNTGKTSLFNALTGSYEYVGNWSGVTIEKKVGNLHRRLGRLIDLPGVYSLSPLSRDEAVAARFLMDEEFSLVLNVVDASQLERNLHLTVQLLELGKPAVMALNMIDVAEGRGLRIDTERLSSMLGIPVVPVVARTRKGCEELIRAISAEQAADPDAVPLHIDYGIELEEAIAELCSILPAELHSRRWLALQFFERNAAVKTRLEATVDPERLERLMADTEKRIREAHRVNYLGQFIRLKRGEAIAKLLAECVGSGERARAAWTEKIDRILTNKFLGMPIFLVFMYFTFKLTFDWVGSPLSDRLDTLLNGFLTDRLVSFMEWAGAAEFIKAVIVNGIIAGVGGVLVFVPQIFMLFLIISFIEDSGYMARIATVMDKLMEWAGLNGKAFIPMIIGFGCNVPGIMAARTIESPKERLMTTLLTPLMSCSARLSVYSLFVGAFFAQNQAVVVLSLYVLGIVLALLIAKLFSFTIAKGEESIFIVELPPYRLPQWRTLMRSTWEKGKGFVRKAGTFIFGGSVVIWLLGYTGPSGWNVPMDESFMHVIGSFLAPLFAPIGFSNWQAGASLITGFLAKEVVVSTMNIIYAAPDEIGLQGMLGQFFTPLQAYSFMAFILLYIPCLATVGVIHKETASVRWTLFSIAYALIVAYIVGLVIYQGGRLLGFQ